MNECAIAVPDAIAAFAAVGAEEKACFLAHLAHELTIVARDSYEVGSEGVTDPARLRAINEVQHRLLAFLVSLLSNERGRYPDDVLVRIVLEHPRDAVLERQMSEAFHRALSLVAITGVPNPSPSRTGPVTGCR